MKPLVVFNCGQLLSFRGPRLPRIKGEMADVGLIRNGAVLIQGDSVAVVGSLKEVRRALYPRRVQWLDAQGRVVLPGFVDSHTHALFARSRVEDYVAQIQGATYEELAKAGGGIQASARHTKATSELKLTAHLERMSARFLEYGTTTAEVKSGYGLEPAQELKMLRAIYKAGKHGRFDWVPTLLIHDVPVTTPRKRRAHFVKVAVPALIREVVRRKLADFFDVFCDRGFFSVSETRGMLLAATRAGLKLKAHVEQLAHTGAASLAAQLGAVTVDHVDRVRSSDIRALKRASTIATLLPGSVFHLASGCLPPARKLIDAGVPVALATNFNPGSSPTVSMQMILSLACGYLRMTPAEALTASTINGAWAAGCEERVGSLEAGKQADLVIMDVDDYRELPYFFGMNHCLTVIKKGRVVFSKTPAHA